METLPFGLMKTTPTLMEPTLNEYIQLYNEIHKTKKLLRRKSTAWIDFKSRYLEDFFSQLLEPLNISVIAEGTMSYNGIISSPSEEDILMDAFELNISGYYRFEDGYRSINGLSITLCPRWILSEDTSPEGSPPRWSISRGDLNTTQAVTYLLQLIENKRKYNEAFESILKQMPSIQLAQIMEVSQKLESLENYATKNRAALFFQH